MLTAGWRAGLLFRGVCAGSHPSRLGCDSFASVLCWGGVSRILCPTAYRCCLKFPVKHIRSGTHFGHMHAGPAHCQRRQLRQNNQVYPRRLCRLGCGCSVHEARCQNSWGFIAKVSLRLVLCEIAQLQNLTKDARCLLGGFSMDAKAAARSGAR